MPIPFTCPHCQHATSVADEYAGQTGPCSNCGESITIPSQPIASPPVGVGKPSAGAGKSSGSATTVLAVIAVVAILFGLLCVVGVGAIGMLGFRNVARSNNCSNNLKQIALSMHNYHDTFKKLPYSSTADENGNPMHSWRAAELPFLEQQAMYEAIDFHEPWDSRANIPVTDSLINVYLCDSDSSAARHSYQVAVGGTTPFPGANQQLGFRDITDGTSNTMMAGETIDMTNSWAEPVDFDYLSMSKGITPGGPSGELTSNHGGGANFSMMDGSVRFLPVGTSPQTIDALLQRNDGTPFTLP